MGWFVTILIAALVFMSGIVGLMAQSWAPFWFGTQGGSLPIRLDMPAAPLESVPVPVIQTGGVTDAQRYQLARAVGFSPADAITATAISIAEDGSGNPAALSSANFDGSRDLGLWQINSGWWARFGGQVALIDPMTNARAAYAIYGLQGWCAWSTYEERCGVGHNGSYRAFLGRARVVA